MLCLGYDEEHLGWERQRRRIGVGRRELLSRTRDKTHGTDQGDPIRRPWREPTQSTSSVGIVDEESMCSSPGDASLSEAALSMPAKARRPRSMGKRRLHARSSWSSSAHTRTIVCACFFWEDTSEDTSVLKVTIGFLVFQETSAVSSIFYVTYPRSSRLWCG